MSRKKDSAVYRVWLTDRVYVEPRRLPSHILKLDYSYQREIDMNRVQQMVNQFNPCVVNPLKVSHRNGHYYVFDGSHTLMALKQINKNLDTFPVECRVYENLTYEEENALFSAQFGICQPISVQNEMNALKNVGDEETLDIIRATEEAGFSLAIKGKPDGSIRALKKVRSLYRRYGRALYVDTLTLIRDTWGGKNGSLTANILGGVCVFLSEFDEDYLRDRFIKKLKESSPESIRTVAKRGKVEYQTLDASVATEIAALYNYGGGKGRLDPVRASRVVEY